MSHWHVRAVFSITIIIIYKITIDEEMRMLRRIKGVTLRDRVKSVDIRKELGVSSIQEKEK